MFWHSVIRQTLEVFGVISKQSRSSEKLHLTVRSEKNEPFQQTGFYSWCENRVLSGRQVEVICKVGFFNHKAASFSETRLCRAELLTSGSVWSSELQNCCLLLSWKPQFSWEEEGRLWSSLPILTGFFGWWWDCMWIRVCAVCTSTFILLLWRDQVQEGNLMRSQEIEGAGEWEGR